MHICVVGFLHVYTCTAHGISMHLTAFHRSENGDQIVYLLERLGVGGMGFRGQGGQGD